MKAMWCAAVLVVGLAAMAAGAEDAKAPAPDKDGFIPLFDGPVPQADLTLAESKTYPNGFMLARYRVRR